MAYPTLLCLRRAPNFPLSKLADNPTARMASTFVGQTGRVYVQCEVLQRREDPKLNVFRAESDNQSFVFKRVPRRLFDQSQRVASEFARSDRLRTHVDYNEQEGILVSPYFTGTLLGLIQEDIDLSMGERKKILRHVAEAIQELHHKDWIHNDVKPDNILVDWTCDEEGKNIVNRANLGDFDIAFNLPVGEQLDVPYAIGNVMWRSPEGQTGRGLSKASDIYSFGLVCLYSLGAGDLLLIKNNRELQQLGIPAEQEILTRHFRYFGPVPEGLFKVIDDEQWCKAFRAASEVAEDIVKESPGQRFSDWGQQLGHQALAMIGGMMNLSPRERITIDQVLQHEFWQEDT